MIKIKNSDSKILYKETREGDILHSCSDNSLAKKLLNWEPKVTLSKGLKELI